MIAEETQSVNWLINDWEHRIAQTDVCSDSPQVSHVMPYNKIVSP